MQLYQGRHRSNYIPGVIHNAMKAIGHVLDLQLCSCLQSIGNRPPQVTIKRLLVMHVDKQVAPAQATKRAALEPLPRKRLHMEYGCLCRSFCTCPFELESPLPVAKKGTRAGTWAPSERGGGVCKDGTSPAWPLPNSHLLIVHAGLRGIEDEPTAGKREGGRGQEYRIWCCSELK